MFSSAATPKYAEALPVTRSRYGKALALTKEPILPSIFIAPETLPAFLPATSAQNTQLGLIVMSAPNTARVKQSTAVSGAAARVTPSSPATASTKPVIPGSRRDHARNGV